MLPKATGLPLVLLFGTLTATAFAENSFSVTGVTSGLFAPDAFNGLSEGSAGFVSASFQLVSTPPISSASGAVEARVSDDSRFLTISTGDCSDGLKDLGLNSTSITLFACVDNSQIQRGYNLGVIIFTDHTGVIPEYRLSVLVVGVPTGEIKTNPPSPIPLFAKMAQPIFVTFNSQNGADGGQATSSDTVESITVDSPNPDEGQWLQLDTSNCLGAMLMTSGKTSCTLTVTADPTKLKRPAQKGNYNSDVIIVMQNGDRGDVEVTFNYMPQVVPPLMFTSSSSFNGTAGKQFSATITASGGMKPYTFSVTELPSGLTINSETGVISGTVAAGTYMPTVTVQDSAGASKSERVTITILSQLEFDTTSPLNPGTAGVSYSQPVKATGGMPPYNFATQNPPPGLTLSADGVLSGVPKAGTWTFTVYLTDSLGSSSQMEFDLTVNSPSPVLQVTPSALTFTAVFEGDSPPPQYLDVIPVGAQPSNFHYLVDSGSNGTPSPPWISIQAINPLAPARLVIKVKQGNMPVQTFNARVLITDSSNYQIIVVVVLKVMNAAPRLQVTPDTLRFSARAASPGKLAQMLVLQNAGGGGPISFKTAIQENSHWITGIVPATNHTIPNSVVLVSVQIDTHGLQIGSYHDVILLTAGATAIRVPVALFVSDHGPILGVSTAGVRFQARQGGGFANPQTIQVLDLDDTVSSGLAWSAQLIAGSQFFLANTSSGNATPSEPGQIELSPTSNALQSSSGSHYALLKISSTQALNSPAYVVLVLDLQSSTSQPLPDVSPAGLCFIANSGMPQAKAVTVYTSSQTNAPVSASVQTADRGKWLSASPVSAAATGLTPVQIAVTADPSRLTPGIYHGEVNISMSGELRSVFVTLIVQRAATIAALPAAASCPPSKIVLTETGLLNNFAIPFGLPATLAVQLNNDCGSTVTGGFITASFSNGDPPLTLREIQPGTYTATWQPSTASPQTAITLRASYGQLTADTVQLIGSVDSNRNPPPIVQKNGVLNLYNNGIPNVSNPVLAGVLAPGMLIEVNGTGLSTAKASPTVPPLPITYKGVNLIVGTWAPLVSLSSGQLNAQVPVDLKPNRQYPVVVSVNGALSVPAMADILPVQPGVEASDDGYAVAERTADKSSVDVKHPAKPGEEIIIHLSGMGLTNPKGKSGYPAPNNTSAVVTDSPTVSLDGQNATVKSANLTPNSVGRYEVLFQVPSNAKSGDLVLVVSQDHVSSNSTKLPVAK